MRILSVVSSLTMLMTPVLAQTLPDFITNPNPPAEEPAAEGSEELSELEMLSRLEDDPFAGVLDREAREPVSVTLRALNKVTARYTDIEIDMNQIARFGSLELQPRTCDKRPPEEFPETTAFLEIFDTKSDLNNSNLKVELPEEPVVETASEEAGTDNYDPMLTAPEALPSAAEEASEESAENDLLAAITAPAADEMSGIAPLPAPEVLEGPQAEGDNIFRGWMFASSPALNALEHPVYDVWVIDCKTRVASN